MSETPKQENVIDISTAPSFGRGVAEALSTMSTLSKVSKPRVSRNPKQGSRRVDTGRGKHRLFVPSMSRMDNHPSKTGRRRGVAETKLVEAILKDIEILTDYLADAPSTRDALTLLRHLLEEEYL